MAGEFKFALADLSERFTHGDQLFRDKDVISRLLIEEYVDNLTFVSLYLLLNVSVNFSACFSMRLDVEHYQTS